MTKSKKVISGILAGSIAASSICANNSVSALNFSDIVNSNSIKNIGEISLIGIGLLAVGNCIWCNYQKIHELDQLKYRLENLEDNNHNLDNRLGNIENNNHNFRDQLFDLQNRNRGLDVRIQEIENRANVLNRLHLNNNEYFYGINKQIINNRGLDADDFTGNGAWDLIFSLANDTIPGYGDAMRDALNMAEGHDEDWKNYGDLIGLLKREFIRYLGN